MPFTPAHILAVVPIAVAAPRVLPFSALAIGSMIPDLPLFVPIGPGYQLTHSTTGVFTSCLPLGLAGFLTFQYVMKRPLLALAPAGVQRRCAPVAGTPVWWTVRGFIGVLSAISVGALTHIFWDAFTHRGRWGTRVYPALREPAIEMFGQQLAGSEVLQYASSIVGLAGLVLLSAWWLARQPPSPEAKPEPVPAGLRLTAGTALVALPIAVAAIAAWRFSDEPRLAQLTYWIRGSGLALLIAATMYCLAFHAVFRRGAHGGA